MRTVCITYRCSGASSKVVLADQSENVLQVSLSFYEKRFKRQGWPLNIGSKDERFYWEQWYVMIFLVLRGLKSKLDSAFDRVQGTGVLT